MRNGHIKSEMFRKAEPKKIPTIWQLYANFGPGGGGRKTIEVFHNAEEGLKFINDLNLGRGIDEQKHDNVNYYAMEFTAKQALEAQFLDMSSMPNSDKDVAFYLLILEEVKLNKQLVKVIPEEDQ